MEKVVNTLLLIMHRGNETSDWEDEQSFDYGAFIKRTFDIICSIAGMIIFSPLYLFLYIAVKREDGGCAIFKQERVGYKGEAFTLYKFRSMPLDAESEGNPILCSDKDDRLTHVGSFIRSHHLDELPQLWNVLRGDMSFVGYRPERQYFIDKISAHNPNYKKLYAMRPGLFSKATLYNGYTDTMEKMLIRLDMDLDYLANHSFWGDVKIIWLTAYSIISGKTF